MEDTVRALGSIDLSAPEFWRLPWVERENAFAALRAGRPVAFFEEPEPVAGAVKGAGYYALTRHADISDVSRQASTYCSGQGALSVTDAPAEINEYFGSLISMDDPRHARLRRIVAGTFTPRMLARMLDHVERTATRVIDEVAAQGHADLVSDIAAPFPLYVILDLMGIPHDRADTVLRCANVILSGGDPEMLGEGVDFAEALLEAGMTMAAVMAPLVEERRSEPTEDLTSALLHAEVDGERITEQELTSFFILLCVAGTETTRTAVSHGIWALHGHPDQRAALAADYETLAPAAVEEIVRWASPVICMRRTVTTPSTLGGVDLAPGDKLLLLYASANRDEAVFDHPERFDIRRQPNNHLGFGGPGPHFCLGAHLARREITVMLRELLTRLPDLTVTTPPTQLHSSFINGIMSMPVSFTPTR